jgi:hypothetical protein
MLLASTVFGQVKTHLTKPGSVKNFRSIEYHLPKKYLKVKVKYTLTDMAMIFKKSDPKAKCQPMLKECRQVVEVLHDYSVSIKDAIIVEEILAADSVPYILETTSLGKRGRGYSFSIESDKHGIFTGINANQEPVTAEIIGGIVGVVTNVISAASGLKLHGFDSIGSEVKIPDEVKITEDKIEAEQIIEINEGTFTFVAPTISANYSSIPDVTIKIARIGRRVLAKGDTLKFPVTGIVTLAPAPAKLSVLVENNGQVESATVIEQIIEVPQFGTRRNVALPVDKGNKTVVIAIDPTTGILTKFEDKKVSTTKATFEKINTSTKELSDATLALIEANKDKKQTAEKKLQAEIDKLKLENSLLDAQIENARRKKEMEDVANGVEEQN